MSGEGILFIFLWDKSSCPSFFHPFVFHTLNPSIFSCHPSPLFSSTQLSGPQRLPRVQRLGQRRGRIPADPPAFIQSGHDPIGPSAASAQPSGLDGRRSEQRWLQREIRYPKVDHASFDGINTVKPFKTSQSINEVIRWIFNERNALLE